MPVTRLGGVVRLGRKAMLRWLARKQPRSVRLFTQAANAESPGCRSKVPSGDDRRVARLAGWPKLNLLPGQ